MECNWHVSSKLHRTMETTNKFLLENFPNCQFSKLVKSKNKQKTLLKKVRLQNCQDFLVLKD